MTVTLKAPHTHAGKEYKTGDTITVTAHDYEWLLARGIVDPITTKQDK